MNEEAVAMKLTNWVAVGMAQILSNQAQQLALLTRQAVLKREQRETLNGIIEHTLTMAEQFAEIGNLMREEGPEC